MEPTTLAYIGGLIDGEGYIGVVRQVPNGRQLSLRHHIQIVVGMCDEELIRWLISCFPNQFRFHEKRMKGANQRTAYLAIAAAQKAAIILRAVEPYLRLKKRQAVLAIHFQEHIHDVRGYRPAAKGCPRVPESEVAFREEVYHRMRDLNLRGKGPQHTNPRAPSGLAADSHAPEGV